MSVLRFLSVCSGIEATSVAWTQSCWVPVAFSEIEPFACAVLANHYPRIPNIGDITLINGKNYCGTVDLIVGGTPCQDFSVTGKRAGLLGERSELALEFVRLAREISPRWLLWENVPGAFSTAKGRDFGTFIRALAICGYHVAWRVLDAQFFGVPQRRRRIFLVEYLGDWRPAAAVLFESHCLCGDSAPRRTETQNIAGTITASFGRSRGTGTPPEMIQISIPPTV